jgi:hypothetical protein
MKLEDMFRDIMRIQLDSTEYILKRVRESGPKVSVNESGRVMNWDKNQIHRQECGELSKKLDNAKALYQAHKDNFDNDFGQTTLVVQEVFDIAHSLREKYPYL